MTELGYGPQDRQTLGALLALIVQQDQMARQKRDQVEVEVRARGLSLSQFERAVLEGVRPMTEYLAWLREQGYHEEDAATLAELLYLEIEERQARQQKAPG